MYLSQRLHCQKFSLQIYLGNYINVYLPECSLDLYLEVQIEKKKKILEIFFMKMSKAHNTYVDTYAQICQGGIWC